MDVVAMTETDAIFTANLISVGRKQRLMKKRKREMVILEFTLTSVTERTMEGEVKWCTSIRGISFNLVKVTSQGFHRFLLKPSKDDGRLYEVQSKDDLLLWKENLISAQKLWKDHSMSCSPTKRWSTSSGNTESFYSGSLKSRLSFSGIIDDEESESLVPGWESESDGDQERNDENDDEVTEVRRDSKVANDDDSHSRIPIITVSTLNESLPEEHFHDPSTDNIATDASGYQHKEPGTVDSHKDMVRVISSVTGMIAQTKEQIAKVQEEEGRAQTRLKDLVGAAARLLQGLIELKKH